MVPMLLEGVPTIDLGTGSHEKNVSKMDSALRRFGFFYVRNHGVDSDLVEEQFGIAAKLFGLPQRVKDTLGPFDHDLDIGYVGLGTQALDRTLEKSGGDVCKEEKPDTKEQFMMSNNGIFTEPRSTGFRTDPENVFAGSRNFEPPILNHGKVAGFYASALYKLNLQLNEFLFDAIGLHDRATYCSDPFFVLKQMRYAGEPSDPSKGKFGAGPHTDWGSFTILTTDGTPGLEILLDEPGDDEKCGGRTWIPVPPKPGCLIINSGDQIAQLTNGVYKSALHRVITVSSKPRYSTAFFTYFNPYTIVAPLPRFVTKDRPARYPSDRTTLEYFHSKLRESFDR